MADTGPAADSSGNIYLLDANGDFGTTLNASGFPSNGNFGNAFLKISTSGGLAVADYFEMQNQQSENDADADLGSGGALVLPDLTDGTGNVRHLAVGAGKDGHIYVVNRDAMGKFNTSSNNIYQDLSGGLGGGIFGMPAYFNGTLYYGAVGDAIKAFKITNAKLSTGPASQTSNTFPLSGRDAQHFGERHQQRHRVGGGKHSSGRPARLRCQQPARAVQQQPGQRQPRSIRNGQQVHHSHGREWQSVRGDDEQRGSVWAAAVTRLCHPEEVLPFASEGQATKDLCICRRAHPARSPGTERLLGRKQHAVEGL